MRTRCAGVLPKARTGYRRRQARYTPILERFWRSTMSVHQPTSSRAILADPLAQTDLAAAHRLAVLHELEEGIDNHFTVTGPGRDDRYLILPFGLHWSEARASDMIVFDES